MIGDLINSLSALSIPQYVGLAAAILIVYYWVGVILESRNISALGARASSRTSFVPFGITFIYEAVKYAQRNENYQFWLKSFKAYGNPADPYTLETSVGGRRVIITADPENVKAILATQFADYGKGEQFNKEWHAFLGDSIFTTDGEKWHDSRQLIRPQFIKDRLGDLDIFESHYQILVHKLGGNGQTVDVCDLFFRYTLDAAMDFLLGRSVGSLENPAVTFAQAFAEVQHIQSLLARMGPMQWALPKAKYRAGIRILDEFCNPFIDEVLRLSPADIEKKGTSESRYTFLHALAGFTRDRTVLRDQLIAVLLAGRDTTACTLSWLFYELSCRPHIVTKLRNEIKDQVGFHRRPTYADLKAMRYLQHTINETLRIYPIVPFNVRESLKDTTLPRGGGPSADQPIGVPKGTPIGYSTLIMQRREDLYPPTGAGFPPILDFVPERWDGWTPRSWTYIPFNGGPRLCVGQQFALTEIAYTVTRILQRFSRVESRMAGQFPGMQSDIVLQPAKGVKVAFYEDSTEK